MNTRVPCSKVIFPLPLSVVRGTWCQPNRLYQSWVPCSRCLPLTAALIPVHKLEYCHSGFFFLHVRDEEKRDGMNIEVRLAHGFVEGQQGGRLVGSRYAARLAWNEGRTLSPTKIQHGKPVPCPHSTLMTHTHKTRAGRLTRSPPCFCDVCLRRCALSPALANFSSHFTSQPAQEVPNP
jgi:hypothetical protein